MGVSPPIRSRAADRGRRVEHLDEDRRDVVPGDLPAAHVLAEIDSAGARVVGEPAGTDHSSVEPARAEHTTDSSIVWHS
jgi:hypothetical protein